MNVSTDLSALTLRAASPDIGRRSDAELDQILYSLPEKDRTQVDQALQEISNALGKLRPFALACLAWESRPEKSRHPQGAELSRIIPQDCVVFTKRSMLQYDMETMGKSREQVQAWYLQQGYSEGRIKNIMDSHFQQQLSHHEMQRIFNEAGIKEPRIFTLDSLNAEQIRSLVESHSMIFSLGGDDHAKAVSHYVGFEKYFAIVNSDPVYSNGAITYFSRDTIGALFERLAQGHFLIEEWPRLEVTLVHMRDGKEEILACPGSISEISVADEFSLYTFRGTVEGTHAAENLVVKGSGLLLTTGTGSTGWFSSAGRYIYPHGRKFHRTDHVGEFIVREPYGDSVSPGEMTGTFSPQDTLIIRTSSKHCPEISGDSVWKFALPAGAEARVSLSRQPLLVVSDQSLGE